MLNAAIIVTCVLPPLILSQRLAGIRLQPDDGASLGKLEVLLHGENDYIPVCYDHSGYGVVTWNNQAAWVACRHLGFYGGRKTVYEVVSDGPKLYNVSCGDGLNNNMERCSYKQTETACLREAGVECFEQESEFRVSHDDPLKGRLEMSYNGQWIPVCYDGGDDDHPWSDQEAWVTCLQIGYHGGRRIAYEGLPAMSDWNVNDVRCGRGFYTDLKECSFELEDTPCKNNQQAGVECFDLLDIRLVHEVTFKATPELSEGRLEMSYQGTWIAVCNYGGMPGQDNSWSYQAAWVACRQLGYYGGRRREYKEVSVTSEFTVNDVRCINGMFYHLQECVFELENTICHKDRQAGVECFETILDIKLVHEEYDIDPLPAEGRLEMLYKGQWLPLCYDGVMSNDIEWNNQAAWVACRQLGYYGGRSKIYDGLSVNSSLKVMDVRCGDGLFNNLHECFFEVEETGCYEEKQAGVECFNIKPDIHLVHNGELEMLYENQWIAVCYNGDTKDTTWNSQSAWVACRQLGHHGGRSKVIRRDQPVSSGLSVNNVRCGDGLFYHIQECFFELQDTNCNGQYAGIECFDRLLEIRLADNATTIGRLEISNGDDWVAVCFDGGKNDETWNDGAASVACRQLGFYGGKATVHHTTVGMMKMLHVKDVRCGHDFYMYDHLQNCSFEVERTDCGNGEEAGVECYETTTTPATSSDKPQNASTGNPIQGANQDVQNAAIGGGVAGGIILFILFIVVILICYKYKNKEVLRRTSQNVRIISNPDILNDALHTNPAYGETDAQDTNTYQEERGQTSSEYTYIDANLQNARTNQNHNDNEYAYAQTPGNLNPRSPSQSNDDNPYAYAETPGGMRPSLPAHSATNSPEIHHSNDNLYAYAETPGGRHTQVSADPKPSTNPADEGWNENTIYITSGSNGETKDAIASRTDGDHVDVEEG
ncbi:scavenger receptor cysteine-rich domain superfamily protein-like isoform X2 [Amphiura filiformis]|uniref:scavenger receptor cysteine-rich domain superfamily protein-like isoform X2 n=1 Tax=Amphiura filiformis TaxID=82378 RepID=UPI003B224654